MPRDLILGTAGHIDHGKTSLVRALTGTDCDRLPEEKARGITIDIGFARLDLGDVRYGVVDVPGHERFVRNMLAGASGIDVALLVVAADDGVMPQTREHLGILTFLGVRGGVVALSKCDAVDADTRGVVGLELRDLLAGTPLADAPIVATSAKTGEGLDAIREALRAAAARVPADAAGPFRLAIDRAFALAGYGAVVTGSVTSGRLRVGDEVEWLPGGERLRVRALHHHGEQVEEVSRGQRAAVNLAGVDHTQLARGQELVAPGSVRPSRLLTVQLTASNDAPRPLKHRLPVRLHIGTAEVMATLTLLDADKLEPGQGGPAQLFLDEPAMAAWGQPVVVRDASAEATLGGGRVVQPAARKLKRGDAAVVEQLERLRAGDEVERATAAAWFRGAAGLTLDDARLDAGVTSPEALAGLATVAGKHLHPAVLGELEGRLLAAVGRMHAAAPLLTALDRPKVAAQLAHVEDESLVQAVIDRLLAARKLVGDGKRVMAADFKPLLSASQRKLKDAIVEAHRVAGFQPPAPASFAAQAGAHAPKLGDIFAVAVAEGLLAKATPDIYLHADAEQQMRERVRQRLAEVPAGLTVADIRDLLGTTRKYAVPLCEYLDRVGVTRRAGDLRLAGAGA